MTGIAVRLGHSDPRTTYQTYMHVLPDAPERLGLVMGDVLSFKTQLALPLQLDALHETASPLLRAGHTTRGEASPSGSSIE